MGKIAAASVRVLLDQFDVSGFLNATDQTIDQETPDVTCFSDAGPRVVPGNYNINHSDVGFFDAAVMGTTTFEKLINDLTGGGTHYLTKCFAGDVEGVVCYSSVMQLKNRPLTAAKGGAIGLKFDSAGDGQLQRGLILASAAVAGAGNRTGRNQGVTTSPAIYRVIFRLLAFNGTNITLKVQSSTDDGAGDAYADVASLTSGAMTAVGVVMASTTATTEAWKRVNISGTFTTATIHVVAGQLS